MLVFLRIIGITNAAIWLGTAVVFTIAVEPAFLSPKMLALLPKSHAGAAAQIVLERYFILLHWCGALALIHFLTEWLYAGRPLRRWLLYLIVAMFALGIMGGSWVLPKLKHLHVQTYGTRSTPQQRQEAVNSYGVWHAVAQTLNFITILGLGVYTFQICTSGNAPRFVSANKFRG